jgi:hypothetical protein
VKEINIARKQALELGLKKFMGAECQYGHGRERQVSSNTCTTCQRNRNKVWQDKNRETWLASKRSRRAANLAEYRARDRVYDAVRDGKQTVRPERGTGVLQPNLRANQCRAIIKQPVAPPGTHINPRQIKEMNQFKKDLPSQTICCGAPTVPGSRFCRYHDAAVADASELLEKATAKKLAS